MFHLRSLVSSLVRWLIVVSLSNAPVVMEYGDNESLGQYLVQVDNVSSRVECSSIRSLESMVAVSLETLMLFFINTTHQRSIFQAGLLGQCRSLS